MYVLTDNNNQITQLVSVGSLPDDGFLIPEDTPTEILKNIFDYKFIDGIFVKKENADKDKLEKIIDKKIQALSAICKDIIIRGVDFNNEHYSLEEHDQINLNDLKENAIQGNSVLYHPDNGLFRIYSSEEFLALVNYVSCFKTFHNTYFNYLKATIKEMTSIDDILKINYGSPLRSDLKENFNVLTKDMNFVIPYIEDTNNYKIFLNQIDKLNI